MYDSPADIDLWAAGIAERTFQDGLLGRTFNCLVSRQFQAFKFGDRFFHGGPSNPNPFSPAQLGALRARRLGDIICDNTVVKRVSSNVFLDTGRLDVPCGQHNRLDLGTFF